jgi:hypothetical protein
VSLRVLGHHDDPRRGGEQIEHVADGRLRPELEEYAGLLGGRVVPATTWPSAMSKG